MKLPTEVFGDVAVVHTPEELGGESVEQFEQFLGNLDQLKIVIDLDGTEAIGSSGLTALLDAQEALRQCGGDLKITTSNKTNTKIFEITRLDAQLELFESVIDAVKSFG